MDHKIRISANHRYFWPIIAAASVLALVMIGCCLLLVEHMFDQPVAVALAAARQNADFLSAIGEPSHTSFMTTGRSLEKNGGGNADLTIRVSGPEGSGKLLEWAQKENGKWHVCSLTLILPDASKSIEIVPDSNSHCERE